MDAGTVVVLAIIGVGCGLVLLLEYVTIERCPKCRCTAYTEGKWPHFVSDVIIAGCYDNRKCVKCGHTWIEWAESGVEVSLGG